MKANPGRAAIAGSAALWYHLGCPTEWLPGDVDIFLLARRGLVVREIVDLAPPAGRACDPPVELQVEDHDPSTQNVFRIMNGRTLNGGKLQFVLSNLYANVDELFASFDLTAAMVAVVVENSVPRVVVGKEHQWPDCTVRIVPAIHTHNASSCFADKVDRWHALLDAGRTRTLARVEKYKARGMNTPSIDEVPTAAVLGFQWAYVGRLMHMASAGCFKDKRWAQQAKERQAGRWKAATTAITHRPLLKDVAVPVAPLTATGEAAPGGAALKKLKLAKEG